MPVLTGVLSGVQRETYSTEELTAFQKEKLKSLVYGPGDELSISIQMISTQVDYSPDRSSIEYGEPFVLDASCSNGYMVVVSIYMGDSYISNEVVYRIDDQHAHVAISSVTGPLSITIGAVTTTPGPIAQ